MKDKLVGAGLASFTYVMHNPKIRRRPRTVLKCKTHQRWNFLAMGTSSEAPDTLLHREEFNPPITIKEGEKLNITFKLTVDEESEAYNAELENVYVYREFDPPV